MRKLLLALVVGSALTFAGVSSANAAVRGAEVSGIGRYYCYSLSTTAHHVYYHCSVRDTACDGHDVYLQVRGSSSSWTTDWGRMIKDTPGGCNTSAEYRGDTWFLTAIDRGQVRICQNDFGWDTCGGATDWFS